MRVRKSGSIRLSRKTQADRMRKKLNALGEHLSLIRVHGTHAMQQYVLNHVRGICSTSGSRATAGASARTCSRWSVYSSAGSIAAASVAASAGTAIGGGCARGIRGRASSMLCDYLCERPGRSRKDERPKSGSARAAR